MKGLRRTVLIAMACALTGLGLGCRKNSAVAGGATTASLDELNRALSLWEMSKGGELPPDVFALTNSPVLKGKSLPAAPAGQKLVIDVATRQVVFTGQ